MVKYRMTRERPQWLKGHLLVATLVGMAVIPFVPCAQADLFVCNPSLGNILRYDEKTGGFLDEFIALR
jgi:hypothetical protein